MSNSNRNSDNGTTPTDYIKSLLYGTGISARSKADAEGGDVPSGLAVIVEDERSVAVSFKRTNVGRIFRTSSEDTGEQIWQSRDVGTACSKDLHRVVFELASLHPPLG
jgi:hypothetical protein